jgi:hypothetical protein
MAVILKDHTPIATRSPYFINCVPATGTIVSAELVVTVQKGSRLASVTSMTDIKSYTLTKTDAIDGIIIFDVSPLVRDFYDQVIPTFSTSVEQASETGQVYFFKVVKTIVNSVGSESPATSYYTIKDAYAGFKDGVNYLPSTGATGNYPFPETVAYGTDVTLMATDCYRQIGQNSFALIGFNLGEFDRANSDTRTWSRVKFGVGEDWKTSKAATTNVAINQILAPGDSATRLDNVEQSIQYIPLGASNMDGDWETGFNYLRVGHFVYAEDIGGSSNTELITITSESDFSYTSGEFTFSIDVWTTGTPIIVIDEQLAMTLPAFTGCGQTFTEDTQNVEVVAWDGSDFITVIGLDAGFTDHMECVATTVPATSYQLKLDIRVLVTSDLIASINDQPTLRYEILCEPKYNVIDCVFINKWGCWDSFSFLKKSVQRLATTSSEYRKSIGSVVSNAYSYSITDAQKVQYNKNGFKSITVNTGFVDESFNLLLNELMLSEKIYLIIDDVAEPVILNTSGIEFKTGLNDKTINYTLGFDFAYNEIQGAI